MGDQQHGLLARRVEHVLDQLARGRRIEVGGRLVEHEHRRAREQRPREDDPLPLPAGQLATCLADERVERRRGAADPVPDPRAAQRVLDLVIGRIAAGRGARCRGCRREQVRLLAGDRDRAPDVRPGGSRADRVRRASRARARDRGSAAAGWRPSSCRRRSGPTQRDPLARLEPEAHAVERGARLARVARAHALERHRERPPGAGPGWRDRARRPLVGELEDPPAAASVADSSRAAAASGVTASNDASASSASSAISTRSSPSGSRAPIATASTPATVTPVTTSPSAVGHPGGERVAAREVDERRSAARTRVERGLLAAERDDLGAAPSSSTSSADSSPRAPACRRPARAPSTPDSAGTADAPPRAARREHEAGGGEERGGDADRRRHRPAARRAAARGRAGTGSGARRRPRPSVRAGRRCGRTVELRRGERLDAARRSASAPGRARGSAMSCEASRSRSGRPGDRGRRTARRRSPPSATGSLDARPRARSDSRPSPSARRRTRPSARRARRAPTRRRRGERDTSLRTAAASAAHAADPRPRPAPRRRRRGGPRGRRAGRARGGARSPASSGRAAAAAPPRTTIATLGGSRSAVGSSRITSGASRRNARARPIRRRSPGDSGRAAVADQRVVAVRQSAR